MFIFRQGKGLRFCLALWTVIEQWTGFRGLCQEACFAPGYRIEAWINILRCLVCVETGVFVNW